MHHLLQILLQSVEFEVTCVHLVVFDRHLVHDFLQFYLFLERSILIGQLDEIVVIRYGFLQVVFPFLDLLCNEVQLGQPNLQERAESFQDALGVHKLVKRLLIRDLAQFLLDFKEVDLPVRGDCRAVHHVGGEVTRSIPSVRSPSIKSSVSGYARDIHLRLIELRDWNDHNILDSFACDVETVMLLQQNLNPRWTCTINTQLPHFSHLVPDRLIGLFHQADLLWPETGLPLGFQDDIFVMLLVLLELLVDLGVVIHLPHVSIFVLDDGGSVTLDQAYYCRLEQVKDLRNR